VSKVSVVLLAAGAGSRFGGGKLLAPYRGRPLIESALRGLRESPVDEIIVVLGAEGERLLSISTAYGARVVENPNWSAGMSTSIKVGLSACGLEVRAAVVALADQPLVGSKAVARLVETFERGAKVAVASYGGHLRNPALFSREVWPLLSRELSGDQGARTLIRRYPELVTEVRCDDVADPADVDTVEDLRRLEGLVAPPRGRVFRKGGAG
jgi:CTP:molybdopterin cytidylyltransferase MocA